MIPPFDVFKMEDGTYVWKGVAENLELARSKVDDLGPGEYMIFSQKTENKILVKGGLPEPGPAS